MSCESEEQFLYEHMREECIASALTNLHAVFDAVTAAASVRERRDATTRVLEYVLDMVEPHLIRGV